MSIPKDLAIKRDLLFPEDTGFSEDHRRCFDMGVQAALESNYVQTLVKTLDFVRLHMKSMEGYSLVWGAINEINKALEAWRAANAVKG